MVNKYTVEEVVHALEVTGHFYIGTEPGFCGPGAVANRLETARREKIVQDAVAWLRNGNRKAATPHW